MTQSRGRSLVSAFCVAALLLLAPLAWAAPLDELFDRLPSGGRTAIAVDFATLRGSKHFKGVLTMLDAVKELRSVRVAKGSGLHPSSDLDAIAMVVMKDGRAVAAVRGKKLDPETTRTWLTGKGKLKEKKVGAHTILTGKGRPSVAFIDETTALVGPADLVKLALGVVGGKKKAVFRSGGLAGVHKSAPKSAPFWSVGVLNKDDRGRLKRTGRTVVAGISSYTVKGELGSSLSVSTQATCTSPEAGEALRASIQGRLDAVKGKTALKLLGVSSYLDRVKVTKAGKQVTLKVDLDDGALGVLLTVGPKVYAALH